MKYSLVRWMFRAGIVTIVSIAFLVVLFGIYTKTRYEPMVDKCKTLELREKEERVLKILGKPERETKFKGQHLKALHYPSPLFAATPLTVYIDTATSEVESIYCNDAFSKTRKEGID